MRHSAMDDTTDYYMHYDANVLSEYYKVTDSITEFDDGIKEYYWGISRLPKRYQVLLSIELEDTHLILNQTQVYTLDNQIVYILPYYSKAKAETFFVIHIFNKQNETLFYQTYQNTFIILFTLLLFVVILYILHTNRQITRQMTDFSTWIKALSHLKHVQLKQEKMPKSLKFEELINSANYLQLSLLTQYELQQKQQELLTREKHFLSSLSHELRTPIAIISAALALLEQSKNITTKDKDKLVKLSKAHSKMKQLTHTLLQLWRGQQDPENNLNKYDVQNKVFLLAELIEQAALLCQQKFIRRNIDFSVSMNDEASLFGQYELAEILINNLMSNACQYSADGKVKIELNHHSLVVQNTVTNAEDTGALTINTSSSTLDYGYGLGLFIVDKICQQQQWQLTITTNAQFFTVTIIFRNVKE
jgi:signal transduction histidine kinase